MRHFLILHRVPGQMQRNIVCAFTIEPHENTVGLYVAKRNLMAQYLHNYASTRTADGHLAYNSDREEVTMNIRGLTHTCYIQEVRSEEKIQEELKGQS